MFKSLIQFSTGSITAVKGQTSLMSVQEYTNWLQPKVSISSFYLDDQRPYLGDY